MSRPSKSPLAAATLPLALQLGSCALARSAPLSWNHAWHSSEEQQFVREAPAEHIHERPDNLLKKFLPLKSHIATLSFHLVGLATQDFRLSAIDNYLPDKREELQNPTITSSPVNVLIFTISKGTLFWIMLT
jgi:hypothetical protein